MSESRKIIPALRPRVGRAACEHVSAKLNPASNTAGHVAIWRKLVARKRAETHRRGRSPLHHCGENAMNPRPSISHRLTRPFSRVTSSGFFLPQIDGLRFVAILAVFLFHLGIFVKAKSPASPGAGWADALLGHVIDKGDLGVQLFFVISGFILALPFAAHFLEGRPRGRLGSYYLRRLTRLEPPYFINLALIVTLLVFVNHRPAGELLPNLFASAGYVSYLTMGHPSLINSVAWSLEVEVQFYLLAPILSLVFCIGSASARRATIFAAMLAGVILQQGLGFTEKTLLGNLQYFMAGFFLCDLYLSRWKRNLSARWGWDIGALLAWIAMGAAHRLGAAWAWSLPVLILIAYCGAFRGAIFAKVLGNPWPATIGGMCYTIYLYHYFLISLAGRFTAHWLPTASYPLAVLVQFFLITPIVLAGCAVLFVIFERPFMNPEWPARMGIVQRKKLRCCSSREQGSGTKTSHFRTRRDRRGSVRTSGAAPLTAAAGRTDSRRTRSLLIETAAAPQPHIMKNGNSTSYSYALCTKYRTTARLLRDEAGTLLDIGSRDCILQKFLPPGQLSYFSADVAPGLDYQIDLEKPLPFDDGAFDHVVALDVLEHVDNIHTALAEVLRITRCTATIALPNAASIRHRLSFLLRGRMGTDKYDLPPERRPDRHHWLTIRPQIDHFIRANAPRHGFAVKAQIAERESGALRPIATLSLALGLHFGGLFSARSIYHLARAKKTRVESRCESLSGELCTAARV
jgi:peptidoglycan/LPS O-acetylase OafA/YrhL/SAM-dependent methyltransferase